MHYCPSLVSANGSLFAQAKAMARESRLPKLEKDVEEVSAAIVCNT